MPENLLTTVPATRINDLFVKSGSTLNFSPVSCAFKDPLIEGRPNLDHRFYAEFYKKIAVDIVVETAMDYPYNFMTEKTYRPIASGRPFIIVGPYHSLFFLRSLGFLTFPSIIDESYDEILDPEQRFNAACVSIKNFVDRPIDRVIEDVSSIKDVLEKNRICLQNLFVNELEKFKEQIKK
jgi:hypothetical protein